MTVRPGAGFKIVTKDLKKDWTMTHHRAKRYLRSYVLAASMVLGIATGTAWADTHYVDPVAGQTIQEVLNGVADGDTVILRDGMYTGEGNRGLEIPPGIAHLTISGENHAGFCIIDAENQDTILYTRGVDLLVQRITFRNGSGDNGGVLHCRGGKLVVEHCEFLDNSALASGGALYLLNVPAVEITNCLFSYNSAIIGAGVFSSFSDDITVTHSTFHRNDSPDSAAVYVEYGDQVELLYSILWNNRPQAIEHTHGEPLVLYCSSDAWYPGPNIQGDPLFASAVFGDHYLGHAYAGYPKDSPCVDAFDENQADQFDIIRDRTTSPFHLIDTGALDLGYHYYPDQSFVPPTPTPTHTVTPIPPNTSTPTMTPTMTPTDTPMPTPMPTPDYEIELLLNLPIFRPAALFRLELDVKNWKTRENPLRLFVVLDMFGDYFMFPSWTQQYDFMYVSVPVGHFGLEIMQFMWPYDCGSVDGMVFHAAFMDRDGVDVIHAGDDPFNGIASVTFSFSE